MDSPEAVYRPAAEAALKAFPVTPGEIVFVNISENVTFKVTDADNGAVYVLRLHRPWYHDHEALKSERVWIRALAEAGVGVPPPVLTRDGEDYVRVGAANGETRWVGLARWIDGEILADVVARETDPVALAACFEGLGGIMAALHNQSETWTPPSGFKRHALDDAGLMGEAPFWGPFWDHAILSPGERGALLAARDRLRAVLRRLPRDPSAYGVIHADLHPGNVLVRPGGLAVIDFDDTAFGWHAYDLAVALVFYRDHPHFDVFRDACVTGYRRIRPLSDDTVALLPMFLLVRDLAQLGWLHQRPEVTPPANLVARKDSLRARAAAFQPPV
jgi:Ser/Thr protein kinase RdoA (MazF antagonist)